MTLSRIAIVIAAIGLAPGAAASAQTAGAPDPVAAQQTELRTILRPQCPAPGESEEIVVCGQRDDDRYRVQPQFVPGSRPAGARAGGEQRAAMGVNDQRCSPIGRDQQCNGGLNVIGIGAAIARGIAQAIANRD